MNKIIILQKIGYSHPSQANWNYDVYQFYIAGEYRKYFKIAFQNKNQIINTILKTLPKLNITNINLIPTIYTKNKIQSIKGIAKILDITDFIKDLNNK